MNISQRSHISELCCCTSRTAVHFFVEVWWRESVKGDGYIIYVDRSRIYIYICSMYTYTYIYMHTKESCFSGSTKQFSFRNNCFFQYPAGTAQKGIPIMLAPFQEANVIKNSRWCTTPTCNTHEQASTERHVERPRPERTFRHLRMSETLSVPWHFESIDWMEIVLDFTRNTNLAYPAYPSHKTVYRFERVYHGNLMQFVLHLCVHIHNIYSENLYAIYLHIPALSNGWCLNPKRLA